MNYQKFARLYSYSRITRYLKASKGNKKKSSMSFPTATGLSFYNLLSKLKRTILIAVAGSIGIIGVSAVLSVSTGVNRYIILHAIDIAINTG